MKRRVLAGLGVAASSAIVILASCVGDDPSPSLVAGDEAGTEGSAPPTTPPSNDGSADTGTDASISDGGVDAFVEDASINGVGGISMWFAGDTNVTANGTGDVSTWGSRAGSPLVVSTTTAAGVRKGTLAGLPSVHFDGKIGSAACPCPGLAAPLAAPIAQPLTVFSAFKLDRYTDTTFNYESIVFGDSPRTFAVYTSIEPGPQPLWAMNAGTKLLSVGLSATDYIQIHILTTVFAVGSSLIRLDGKPATDHAGAVGSGSLATKFVIGADDDALHSFQGDIGEIVFYPRVLTPTEISAVETTLRTKWSLP